MGRPKAEILAENDARRRSEGLVRCVVWIPEEEKTRLSRYVTGSLGGEYRPKSSTTKIAPVRVVEHRGNP